MLPAVAPSARIMRYGYESQWFGEGVMRLQTSAVAQRLLLALRRKRKVQTLDIRCVITADFARSIVSGHCCL